MRAFLPRLSLLALACGIALGAASPAAAQTKLKMVLNWKYNGAQAMFFLAEDRGYFKAEGLDVTFDQGNGSGAAVPLVANGTYDMGFGDINALIELAGKKPGDTPVGVYVMFNQPPFTLVVKADSPIKTPKDFEGKTLGAPANDAALKLFPAFCKLTKIDCSTVKLTNMQPNLREQMLLGGQIDGAFGYTGTISQALKKVGANPDKDVRWFNFMDYGMALYSNTIIVSKKLATENPAAVKGFLRALNKGMVDVIKDPDAGIAAVLKREPLLNPAFEMDSLKLAMRNDMNHPEIATIGLGNADMKRMATAIDILVDAYQLPNKPKLEDIFNPAFLPPVADLPKKLF
jgi:NitT/TauT family transport system substrate-binding protein